MKHESDDDTNCNLYARYSHQRIGTGCGGLGNKKMSGEYTNYSIIKIGQKIKSPEDLRRLPVISSPVRNDQLTLVGKLSKE